MDPKAMLSPHFSFDELTASAKHPDLQDKNRMEAAAFTDELQELAVHLLEPVRARFGPIRITSGYRCPALNNAVGGVATSQHTRAEAVDFIPLNATLDEVFDWCRKSGIKFGQLIREPGWLHFSLGQPYRPGELCRQVLVYDGKTYRRIG